MKRQLFTLLFLFAGSAVLAQTVNTNPAGEAISITGLDVGGVTYNVTSFDGTGVGEAYFWPDATQATAAANAVNAALNAAGVTAAAAGGTDKRFHCVGRTTANNIDSVGNVYNSTTSMWAIDTFAAPFVCQTAGLTYHSTWEVVPAGTVHTNVSGEAIAITGIDVGGVLYNVTSFDGTGAGQAYFWPDAAQATAATHAVNAVLNAANVATTESGGGTNQYHCVGRTTAVNNDSVASTVVVNGATWVIDTIAAPWACTVGGLAFHLTWEPVPAGIVHTNGSGEAIAITGLDIGGVLYNVTSFNGTGAGNPYFWSDATTATVAADAVNAALNGAGVFTSQSASGTNQYHCVGLASAVDSQSIGSTTDLGSEAWAVNLIAAPWSCGVAGLAITTTWERVPRGTVNTNGSGEAISIDSLEVGGFLYNVTSFDGTGAGTAYFWPDATQATEAAEAVNAKLNGVGVFTSDSATGTNEYHCVGLTSAVDADSIGSSSDLNMATWIVNSFVGPWACGIAGINLTTTWELVPAVTAAIDISPASVSNEIHPHHNGGPGSGGLNDLLPVTVLSLSTQVGDPIDLDATTIDPASVRFGPAQASIAPNSIPEFNVDYDQDGLNDAKFEFLMGDTGFTCQDTQATATGWTMGGPPFAGVDSVTTKCNAGCH